MKGLSSNSSNDYFSSEKTSLITDLTQKSYNKSQLSTQKFNTLNSLILQQSQYDGNFNNNNNFSLGGYNLGQSIIKILQPCKQQENNKQQKQFQNSDQMINANYSFYNQNKNNQKRNINRQITQEDIISIKTFQQMILYQYNLYKQNQEIKKKQNENIKKLKDLIIIKKGQIQIQKDYYNRHLIKQYKRNKQEMKMFKLRRYQRIRSHIKLLKKQISKVNRYIDEQQFNRSLDYAVGNNNETVNLNHKKDFLRKFQPHYHFNNNISLGNIPYMNHYYYNQNINKQQKQSLGNPPQLYNNNNQNIKSNYRNPQNLIMYGMSSIQSKSNYNTINPQQNSLAPIDLANGLANLFKNNQAMSTPSFKQNFQNMLIQNQQKKQQQENKNNGNNGNIRISTNKSNSNSNHARQKSQSSNSIPRASSRSGVMKTAQKIDIFNLSPGKFNKKSSKSWEVDGQQNDVLQLLQNSIKRTGSNIQKTPSKLNYVNSKVFIEENQNNMQLHNVRKSQGNISKISLKESKNKISGKMTQSKIIKIDSPKNFDSPKQDKRYSLTNSVVNIQIDEQKSSKQSKNIKAQDHINIKDKKTNKNSNIRLSTNTLQLPKHSPKTSSINDYQQRTVQQILRQKEMEQSTVQIMFKSDASPQGDILGNISRDSSFHHNASHQKDQQNIDHKRRKTIQFATPPLPDKNNNNIHYKNRSQFRKITQQEISDLRTSKMKSQKGNNNNSMQDSKQVVLPQKLLLSQNKQLQISQAESKYETKSIDTNRKNLLNSQVKIQFDSFQNSDQKINMSIQQKQKRQNLKRDKSGKSLKQKLAQQVDPIDQQDDIMGISLQPVSKISRQSPVGLNSKNNKMLSSKNSENIRQNKSNSVIIKTSKQIKNSKIQKKQRKSSIQRRGSKKSKNSQAQQAYQEDDDFFTQISLDPLSKISKQKNNPMSGISIKNQNQNKISQEQQQQDFGLMNSQLRSSTTSKIVKKGNPIPIPISNQNQKQSQNLSSSQKSLSIKKSNRNSFGITIRMDAVQQQQDQDLDGSQINQKKKQIASSPKIDIYYGNQNQEHLTKPTSSRLSVPFS